MNAEHVSSNRLLRALLWIQGLYFTLTGVWPLIDIRSFIAVTGPKTDNYLTGREGDHWLVMTVAVLIVAIGATLLFAAWRGRNPVEIVVLAMASSIALTSIDVIYVVRETIPPIYLVDAAAEVVLLVAWTFALVLARRARV